MKPRNRLSHLLGNGEGPAEGAAPSNPRGPTPTGGGSASDPNQPAASPDPNASFSNPFTTDPGYEGAAPPPELPPGAILTTTRGGILPTGEPFEFSHNPNTGAPWGTQRGPGPTNPVASPSNPYGGAVASPSAHGGQTLQPPRSPFAAGLVAGPAAGQPSSGGGGGALFHGLAAQLNRVPPIVWAAAAAYAIYWFQKRRKK